MTNDLAQVRQQNQEAGLSEQGLPDEPIDLLKAWLDEAGAAGVYLHNTMVVATAGLDGRPGARAVILRQADAFGLVFHTNYRSRKGRELEQNPNAECLLLWPDLARQIRIGGTVAKLSAAESDDYFMTRERGAQLEAWASTQSEVISDRRWLESRFEKFDQRFGDGPVPRPGHWGGYRVQPDYFEFWQGREHRMHDRIEYRLTDEGAWATARLSP